MFIASLLKLVPIGQMAPNIVLSDTDYMTLTWLVTQALIRLISALLSTIDIRGASLFLFRIPSYSSTDKDPYYDITELINETCLESTELPNNPLTSLYILCYAADLPKNSIITVWLSQVIASKSISSLYLSYCLIMSLILYPSVYITNLSFLTI